MSKIRVLVVDDSALIRRLLTTALSTDPEIEVVGTAADPYAARDKINELRPDVLTLDIEMPRMHGLTFLKILMEKKPMPVVMVSTLTARGADITLEALALGAVDFMEKPTVEVVRGMDERLPELLAKIKAAAKAQPRMAPVRPAREKPTAPPAQPSAKRRTQILALGASTGGTEALRDVLADLPADAPAVLVVQHMPADFTKAFAKRCNASSALEVVEASHGEAVVPGRVFIAPGGRHMRLVRKAGHMQIALDDGERINRHRPSVDALFDSVAELVGKAAVGALLTGMGDDGARGLLRMRQAGAHTIAQDRESCIVFGMPREAIALGAAVEVAPLGAIAQAAMAKLA